MADKLLYIEEVAEMLRKSPASLRYQIHKGENIPPSAKVFGRRMFRESDVVKWLDEQFEKETA